MGEDLEKMYDELTEKMQVLSEAFAALFDLVAAFKPPDELISMFGKGAGAAFDEDLGGEEMQEKLEELIKTVTSGMVAQLNGIQTGVSSMVANLKKHIEKKDNKKGAGQSQGASAAL